MSNNNNNNNNTQDDRKPPPKAEPSQPEFRFAQMQGLSQGTAAFAAASTSPYQSTTVSKPSQEEEIDDMIDMNDYRPGAQLKEDRSEKALWIPTHLRSVPAFYPLEKSSRRVDDDCEAIGARISDCCRQLSVQAEYEGATANLNTSEHVELHVTLWQSEDDSVIVEVQRRKGDAIAFCRYSKAILDAAVGEQTEYVLDEHYSKKVQRLLAMELSNQNLQEHENAVVAMEIAHGLLTKDRMDARQLGLESLCLLTDPTKTGYITAVLTSHVVLLGTTEGVVIPGVDDSDKKATDTMMLMDEGPFQEIRQGILGLVQFSRIGEDQDAGGSDADSEHVLLLHNLALAVLANALDVIEHPERYNDEESSNRPRLRTASSSDVTNEFVRQTEEFSKTEILSTLITELGNAQQKPHNATLSAKCLGSLCRASDDAKKRAKELGAKTVVSTALDVGVRTHLKLETECKKVVTVLERPEEERRDDPRPPRPPE